MPWNSSMTMFDYIAAELFQLYTVVLFVATRFIIGVFMAIVAIIFGWAIFRLVSYVVKP